MDNTVQCSEIIRQVNDHAHEGGLLTSDIGLKNGVTSRSCCFCMDRLWAWMKGVSYDKNEVAMSIKTAFNGVKLQYLQVTPEELKRFSLNLNQLNNKFSKGSKFDQRFGEVIAVVGDHVFHRKPTGLVEASKRSTGNMRGASASRNPVVPKAPVETTPLRSRHTQSYGKTHSPRVASRVVAVSGKREESRAFLAFYRNEEKGKNGFMMDRILSNFNEADLEKHHNFIQWIFPTYRPSDFCRNAPLLNLEIVKAFETDGNLQLKQKQALALMLDHYGLQLDLRTDKISINPSKFAAKKKNFFINNSHNLRRISRILSSLISLDQPKLAVEFYNCLEMLSKGPISRLKSSVDNHWKPVVSLWL
jgi:hypothetical protein